VEAGGDAASCSANDQTKNDVLPAVGVANDRDSTDVDAHRFLFASGNEQRDRPGVGYSEPAV
jgi:hypothetical protein